MPPRATLRTCVAIAGSALAVLCFAPVALAIFTDPASGGPLTVATSKLAPPTGATLTQPNCKSGKAVELKIAWTATTSSYATSYTVERATTSSGTYTSVSSVATGQNSYTDSSGSLAYSTTYYYRVSSIYRSWTATSTVASIKSLSKGCLAV